MEVAYDAMVSLMLALMDRNILPDALVRRLTRLLLTFAPDSSLPLNSSSPLSFTSVTDKGDDDWIARYFFSSGTMPAANLLLYFQDDGSAVDHWLLNGKHYAQTSEEWLKRMDKNCASIKPMMESTYGKDSAPKWTVYWRTFFIAVAELFGYNNGDEWMATHFLFKSSLKARKTNSKSRVMKYS